MLLKMKWRKYTEIHLVCLICGIYQGVVMIIIPEGLKKRLDRFMEDKSISILYHPSYALPPGPTNSSVTEY